MRPRSIAGILLFLCFTFVAVDIKLTIQDTVLIAELLVAVGGGEFTDQTKLEVGYVILLFVFGIFALVGAISAFQGKRFLLTILGAICGIIAVGWNYLGSGCALAALIVLILYRNEFDVEYQPQVAPYGMDGYPLGTIPPPPTINQPPVLKLYQDEPPTRSTHRWYQKFYKGRPPS